MTGKKGLRKELTPEQKEVKRLKKKAYDAAYNAVYSKTHKKEQMIIRERRQERINSMVNDLTTPQWIACLAHFDNACAYCGTTEGKMQKEHVIPVSKGGPKTSRNIVPSCLNCNTSKAKRDLVGWYMGWKYYSYARLVKIQNWVGSEVVAAPTSIQTTFDIE